MRRRLCRRARQGPERSRCVTAAGCERLRKNGSCMARTESKGCMCASQVVAVRPIASQTLRHCVPGSHVIAGLELPELMARLLFAHDWVAHRARAHAFCGTRRLLGRTGVADCEVQVGGSVAHRPDACGSAGGLRRALAMPQTHRPNRYASWARPSVQLQIARAKSLLVAKAWTANHSNAVL